MQDGWPQLLGRWITASPGARSAQGQLSAGQCTSDEIASHPLDPSLLAQLPGGASEARIATFSMGRIAGDRALASLGHQQRAIGRKESGAPEWPEGVVGSIAHTNELAVALVGQAAFTGGIGIDLESLANVGEVTDLIAFGDERHFVEGDGLGGSRRLLELFTAKEAIYKAFAPRVDTWFGFDAVRVGPSASTQELIAAFVEPIDHEYPPGREFPVNIAWAENNVVAWVVLTDE